MGLLSKFGRILTGDRDKPPTTDCLWVRGDATAKFPPFTQAQIVRNFNATVNDEVSVCAGSEVRAVYKDHEWIYIERGDGRRGFIPDDHLRLRLPRIYDYSQNQTISQPPQSRAKISRRDSEKIKKELMKQNKELVQRHHQGVSTIQRKSHEHKPKVQLRRADTFHAGDKLDESNLERFLKSLPVEKHEGDPFVKAPQGFIRVRESFENRNAEEVTIAKGEQVMLLNNSDPDWSFVRNQANEEGFVPACCLNAFSSATNNSKAALDVLVVESYRSDAKLDLDVTHGEWLKCENAEVNGWFWGEKLDGSARGFVPAVFCIVATHI